ncbi:MAG: primosomal protein N' [Clostridiales bacterium]|nr:primosomal protein N' [Clostridiales bacterium]
MDELYAEVIINSEAQVIDRPFTYKVKEKDYDIIQVGHRVKVSFGKGNKLVEGFVIGLKCELTEDIKRIKEISSILDKDPILTRDNLKVIDFLRSNYLCKYIDAIRVIIPTGLLEGLKNKTKSVISFNKPLDDKYRKKENYVAIMDLILEQDKTLTKSDVINKYGLSTYSLNKLIKEGYLSIEEQIEYRYNNRVYDKIERKTLNEEQVNAVEKIKNTEKKCVLLKGVTGSGKTEVYMNIVEDVLKQGKSAIMLVPEISLTPQMIERFKGRFGKDVALYHSKLSKGERFDEWYRIKNGEVKLVVGARSAIFLPVENLGLIVIDEEHENSYKSEQNPKYDTREVAKFLSEITDCKLILGSATPSIESYFNALKENYELVEINNRVLHKELPDMQIVDMRQELKSSNMSLLSRKLQSEISNALNNKEQVILFLNRRGFSTFVSCRSCGYVFKCPECDISMTYHKNGYLVCHYCGRAIRETKVCPKCGSKYVKYFGAGTERVEAEVKKIFSKAKVLRMDIDTTRNKNSHEEIYNSFKNGEADILIGTQMVSKGLDFKNVTLVGILAADISLNIPDYRSGERTYQIITQVAGRAGRGCKRGKVIIQTYTPNSKTIKYAIDNDYNGLYNEEINVRKIMNYPPFCNILLINGLSLNEERLKIFMNEAINKIKTEFKSDNLEILGPVPSLISKIKDNYRWQIIIKGNITIEKRWKVKEILYDLYKTVYNEIKITIDINPNNMS